MKTGFRFLSISLLMMAGLLLISPFLFAKKDSMANPNLNTSQTCQRCEVFHKFNFEKIQSYSAELKQATDLLSSFRFSKDRKNREAEVADYVQFALKVIAIDQLSTAQEFAAAAYEENQKDFDSCLEKIAPSDKKKFLQAVKETKDLNKSDDGK